MCGDSMDIVGVYKLNISLDDNAEIVEQKFFVVPQLSETCILGIDFITENALVLDSETRRVNYKIKGRAYSTYSTYSTYGKFKLRLLAPYSTIECYSGKQY